MRAAAVTGGLALGFAGPGVALAVAGSAVLVCALVPVWGWLQGEGRFVVYAGLSVGEVGIRMATSAGMVAMGAGAAGALGGFAAGSATVLALAAAPLCRDLGWRRDVLTQRARWGETGQIALVQVVLSVLVAADVLAVAFSHEGAVAVAGYQALSTVAKAPCTSRPGRCWSPFPCSAHRPGCRRGIARRSAELPPYRAAGRRGPGDGTRGGGRGRPSRGVPAGAGGTSVAGARRARPLDDDRRGDAAGRRSAGAPEPGRPRRRRGPARGGARHRARPRRRGRSRRRSGGRGAGRRAAARRAGRTAAAARLRPRDRHGCGGRRARARGARRGPAGRPALARDGGRGLRGCAAPAAADPGDAVPPGAAPRAPTAG